MCILNCCRVINNLLHVGILDGQARGEAAIAVHIIDSRVCACI